MFHEWGNKGVRAEAGPVNRVRDQPAPTDDLFVWITNIVVILTLFAPFGWLATNNSYAPNM